MKHGLILLLLLVANLQAKDALVIAHRGASAYAPENTLPAFKLAWELDADAIEGDFHLTADGEIVCIHDYSIKKYTGVDKRVEDMTLAELRGYDFGKWVGEKWINTSIPTLSEVLETVPTGKSMFVEIKCGPEIVPELLEQVKASGLEGDQVTFISFNEKVVKRLKKEAPQHTANWLVSVKRDERGRLEPRMGKLMRVLRKSKVDGISTRANEVVDSAFVTLFKKKGLGYHVWTVDDPQYALALLEIGAETITTNKPDVILSALGR
ncbi:glycerophosphodiester phosphodiesterase [Pelagicoccus sp. SDUM812002]|uniref:glycerophosphodiester phosphodiesterase n=1 Tax=Pelagicoccus sp. SDUM812002 TaxID=3041266 RepID=UPI00280C76EE|nr:glycerophosphodiester phosphodiesterase [Pelagicoccus sp. SDUM812002]MDQ8188218.1 glycerophosphodiester phosphodiesterase [Pelagicoccus sp. SDUM812002]